ncbi:MAG: GNAT family N-acetyltransferase [Niabella sp.]|nr:GNAT family N-acetyltransferase [Niabella sp.]
MSSISIKRISIERNIPVVDELVGALHRSEKSLNPRTAEWSTIKADYIEHMIECEKDCSGSFFAALTSNEEAVGFIFGYVEEQDNSNFETGEGDDLYVSEGFVKPEYRKQGIYSMLNKAFEEHYKDFPIRRIFRYTLCTNEVMQQWLANQGYQPVRLVYEKWLR